MSRIFSKTLDRNLRTGLVLTLGLVVGGVSLLAHLGSPDVTDAGYQPKQPVPFSHKLHAGNLGMDCRYCHSTVERAAHAAVPATDT